MRLNRRNSKVFTKESFLIYIFTWKRAPRRHIRIYFLFTVMYKTDATMLKEHQSSFTLINIPFHWSAALPKVMLLCLIRGSDVLQHAYQSYHILMVADRACSSVFVHLHVCKRVSDRLHLCVCGCVCGLRKGSCVQTDNQTHPSICFSQN